MTKNNLDFSFLTEDTRKSFNKVPDYDNKITLEEAIAISGTNIPLDKKIFDFVDKKFVIIDVSDNEKTIQKYQVDYQKGDLNLLNGQKPEMTTTLQLISYDDAVAIQKAKLKINPDSLTSIKLYIYYKDDELEYVTNHYKKGMIIDLSLFDNWSIVLVSKQTISNTWIKKGIKIVTDEKYIITDDFKNQVAKEGNKEND